MLSPRICPRCREEKFGKPGSHLCADLAKRLARRTRQVDGVLDIMNQCRVEFGTVHDRECAERIVGFLANLGVEND